MHRDRRESQALMHSLSEFAYLLLFVVMGAALVLYGRAAELQRRAEEAEALATQRGMRIEELREEVAFLNEMLSEKRYGVVPCWRRPEGRVAPVSARIVIHSDERVVVSPAGEPNREVVVAGRFAESSADAAGAGRAPGRGRAPAAAGMAAPGTRVTGRSVPRQARESAVGTSDRSQARESSVDRRMPPREALRGALAELLAQERQYAGEKNCYLRVSISNRTNDYGLYEAVEEVVTDAGMVVARE
jgi:hypothetical protein